MNLTYGSSDSSDSPNMSLFSSENACPCPCPCVAGGGSSLLSCMTGPSGTAATAIREGGSTQASDLGEARGEGAAVLVLVVVMSLLVVGLLVVVVVVGFASVIA